MKNLKIVIAIAFLSCIIVACKKKEEDKASDGPKVIFKFKFDSTLARLDNFGMPASIPAGHSAQSPVFNLLSSHYVELAPTAYTPLGSGAVLYRAKETGFGGSNAIDFQFSKVVGQGEEFLSVPIKDMGPGVYKWLRVSLAYQNYVIKYKANVAGTDYYLKGTLASFVGFNTYIRSYQIKNLTVDVNANKLQGYWGFESVGSLYSGQAPSGATTVPNPLASTSPIPPGSCVVTGQFATDLIVTGNETKDIIVTVTLSTNNSFEWKDKNLDGWYEPGAGDVVVDMGLRGLYPSVKY
jgi:hypothetical protein